MSSSTIISLYPPNPLAFGGSPTPNQRFVSSVSAIQPPRIRKPISCSALKTQEAIASALLATGLVSALVVGPASAATELPFLGAEPSNALSLPTWAVHVSSVLVAIQAALTVIGNATMCFAAYRIYKSQERSETS
ncbi:hypothetical protein V2J09_014734 [Rumex salicifolius]